MKSRLPEINPASPTMDGRTRFLAACRCQKVDRTPVWLMRQAGRYLPEYRAMKEKHGFLKMVKTPDLAMEITLQPIRRFGFDAAILFSDILVIPEAMGQPYEFREGGGIAMAHACQTAERIEALDANRVADQLDYVGATLSGLKKELGGKTALVGFAGSPWTLATYMVEGGSSTNFQKTKHLFFSEPSLFRKLMEKITSAVGVFLEMQIENGAEALQIFDSWGGICSSGHYEKASLQWIRQLIERIGRRVPVILFAKGLHHRMGDLVHTGADVISVDWTADLPALRNGLEREVALQGNLDPVLLNLTPEAVRAETTLLLDSMRGRTGHVFNLGHGILPAARIENVETLVETIRNYP